MKTAVGAGPYDSSLYVLVLEEKLERIRRSCDEPLAYWRERVGTDPLAGQYVDAFASAQHNILEILDETA